MLYNEQLHTAFEVKAVDAQGRFSGYASIFNVVDAQKDIVARGAFTETLKTYPPSAIKLLWQHRPDEPIGTFTKVKEDDVGLYVQGQLLLDVQRGREAYALLKEGAIEGLSIGYSARRAEIDPATGIRYILEADLWEISIVTFPANPQATITFVKSGEMALCGALERCAEALQ